MPIDILETRDDNLIKATNTKKKKIMPESDRPVPFEKDGDLDAGMPDHNVRADLLEQRANVTGDDESLTHLDENLTETAEAAGDAMVAETVKIPVTYEDTIKGPAGDEDPATQKWRTENWEHDKETANSMAIAGDEKRSIAASNRGKLQFMDEYEAAVRKARKNPFGRRQRLERLWDDPRFETGRDLERVDMKLDVDSFFELPWGRERLVKIQERLTEGARDADERAEKQETWAKILHEHPVSEKYKQAHPDITFGAHSLAHLEAWLPYDQALATKLREEADGIDGEKVLDAIRKLNDELELMEYNRVPQAKMNEFGDRLKALDSSKSSTNSDYYQLCKDVLTAHAEHLVARFEEQTQILEDLRSGRASDPDYQKRGEEEEEEVEEEEEEEEEEGRKGYGGPRPGIIGYGRSEPG